jgi:hypothetical protein
MTPGAFIIRHPRIGRAYFIAVGAVVLLAVVASGHGA